MLLIGAGCHDDLYWRMLRIGSSLPAWRPTRKRLVADPLQSRTRRFDLGEIHASTYVAWFRKLNSMPYHVDWLFRSMVIWHNTANVRLLGDFFAVRVE